MSSINSESFKKFDLLDLSKKISMNDHVLGNFTIEEDLVVKNVLEKAKKSIVLNGVDETMNRFNVL